MLFWRGANDFLAGGPKFEVTPLIYSLDIYSLYNVSLYSVTV